MNLIYYESPVPHIIIEDYYSAEELNNVWKELDFLTSVETLMPPSKTASATDKEGFFSKKNSGVFLDVLFSNNRESSYILKYGRKMFSPEMRDTVSPMHFVFNYLNTARVDHTLVSYYQNSDYYLPHWDISTLSTCTWLFKEPKKFNGGDFNFSDYNYKIQIKNNMTVLFPSTISHSVDEITMIDSNDIPFSGNGRYVISNFIYNVPA
jgi:hypothetical protein